MKQTILSAIIILLLSTLPGCANIEQPTLVPTISLGSNSGAAGDPSGSPNASSTLAAATATPDPGAPLWISNPDDQTVLRIDPLSNAISAIITIEGKPDLVASGEGGVWALDRRQSLVFRIDPINNQVTSTIALPSGTATAITTGSGSVWVGMTGRIDLNAQAPGQEEELQPPGFIVQIDPASGKITGQFPAQPVSRLMVKGSNLWVLSHAVIDTPLQVFDLSTGTGMVMPFKNGPEWLPVDALAVENGSLWLYSAAYGKIFHASANGLIRSAVALEERQPLGYPDLMVDDTGLWAITTWGTVLHIDPATNHILGMVDLNAPLTGLLVSPGAVWVLSQQTAALFRIDPQSHAVAAQIATGTQQLPTIVPTPTARIVIWKPCEDGPTSRLKIGDIAYVTKDPPLPNRVREEPNTDAEILGLIGPGGAMDIVDGPSCSNGWVWWKVKNADLEGWTPEGDAETYWLIPLYK